MSALRDLLAIEGALEGRKAGIDPLAKYLLKQLKKVETKEGEKKKKEEEGKKKGWTLEDRICLGLLMAFLAVPLSLLWKLTLHSLAQ